MAPDTYVLSPVFADLSNLVNNYCDSRSSMNSSNSSSNASASQFWSSLNLPWAAWKQDALVAFGGLGPWLSRYVQYLGSVQNLTMGLPGGTVLGALEQEILNIDPALNFTNVSYGELVTDYNAFYQQFLGWYNLYFGPNGRVNEQNVLDGNTTLFEFNYTDPSLPQNRDVFALEEPLFINSFLSIVDWIGSKFGSVILENSCRLCQSSNSTNGTNSTGSSGNMTNSSGSSGNGTN